MTAAPIRSGAAVVVPMQHSCRGDAPGRTQCLSQRLILPSSGVPFAAPGLLQSGLQARMHECRVLTRHLARSMQQI